LIRSRQDALNVATDAPLVFLLIGAILAALYVIRDEKTLLDAGLYGFLAVLLWRFKSPAAAIALLIVSVMMMFVTLAQVLDTGNLNWVFVGLTVAALAASIRAAEATLKLIGRFAVTGEGEES
jgi:hypothetical protein